MSGLLGQSWFYWAIGVCIGLPLGLVLLTEWQHILRRRGSALLWPVTLMRNYLLPLTALLMLMLGATQMPDRSTPVRIVSTLAAVSVLMLILAGIKAALFQRAPDDSWRRRIPGIFLDVVRFGLIAIGTGLILAYIWGAHIGGLFTALGITSIVIGLALQNSVGQVISGLLMLFEQPFRLGDWIQTKAATGRVVEVNWRAVHLQTVRGLQITPNSVLASESFTNLSRPAGQFLLQVDCAFAIEDHPDRVCATLATVAAHLPQLRPGAQPAAVPRGGRLGRAANPDQPAFAPATVEYRTEIPLGSPGDDDAAEATFRRWIWYAARRAGLHLDGADDFFSDPQSVTDAIRDVVTPILRLTKPQQQAVAPFATLECYGAGELILPAGDVPKAVSFVVSGCVLLTARAEGSARNKVGTLERGSFLGQNSLVRRPVTGFYHALDEVMLLHLRREVVEEVVAQNPLLLGEFGHAIESRLAMVERALEDAEEQAEVEDAEAEGEDEEDEPVR